MAARKILSFGDFYTIVWNFVPSVWKGVDDDYGKSLQLVLYTMAQHMYYYFYNRVVHMDELFDPDLCPEKYLKFLAGMVGWTLQGTDPISWREQIKAAPLLYKLRGTKRGLLLAEKLVGYSVFMSELYRDHVGDIVPKEKIFNNTPESVKIKPWFRQALTTVEGELLPGRAESDQFDSFNQTSLVKLNAFGNVIRPRILSSTRTMTFTPSSTTNIYNNVTGQYSLARYAKLPRINVVLKYDSDLDTQTATGSVKENNFSSALDLLLQFKPFHVLIQNLEVRYDLSEFIFDQTAISSDYFNVQEELDAAIVMVTDRAEHTIAYSPDPVTDISYTPETPADAIDNRGLISSVYQVIQLSDLVPIQEPSLYSVLEKSLPIKSFINVVPQTISLSFDNATSTITRSVGSFTTDNYVDGDVISISGTVSNDADYEILSITGAGTVLHVYNTLITEGPVSCAVYNKTTPTKILPAICGSTLYSIDDLVHTINNVGLVFDPVNSIIRKESGYFTDLDMVYLQQPGNQITIAGTVNNSIDTFTIVSSTPREITVLAVPNSYPIVAETALNCIMSIMVPKISEGGPLEYALNSELIALKQGINASLAPVAIVTPSVENTIYTPGQAVLQYNLFNLLPDPILDFKTMLSSQHNTTDFAEQTTTPIDGYDKILTSKYTPGLDDSYITGIFISDEAYRSTVTTIYDTQTIVAPTLLVPTPLSRPWDLQEIRDFRIKTGIVITSINPDTSLPYVNTDAAQNLAVFRQLYKDTAFVVLENSGFIILTPGIDYYFDNTKNIFLNSSAIAIHLTPVPTTYNFLASCKLHILYLSRITYSDETYLGIPGRGFRYVSRINNKFTRQFLINSLPEQTLSNLMPTELVSVSVSNSGVQQKTVLGTKRFKTPTGIPNRNSLKSKVIDNYSVVSKNPLNRMDRTAWTVYSPEYSTYYTGDQSITNNWWGNYYEVKIPNASPGVPGFVPYSTVDTSRSAQLEHVSSDQWLSALQAYNPSSPEEFLVTRVTNSERAAMWNRSSCKVASTPYIRSRRDGLQVFRKDIPTFTRTEESTDYLADTGVPPRLDNYKYILPDGTDVSMSYFGPGFSMPEKVKVTMDSNIGEKVKFETDPYKPPYGLTLPIEDTYYNNSSFGQQAEAYFTSDYNVKTSLYAGNIPVNTDPSINPGITEGLDTLDLLITGLTITTDNFIATTSNEFTLSETNLFVTWTDLNTGNVVSFGYYPPNITAIPNIEVFLNGILIDYRTYWTEIFDRVKSITIPSSGIGDTVKIVYQVLPGANINTDFPPTPQVPYTVNHTLLTGDITTIKLGNRFIHDLPVQTVPPVAPITGVPCVSWYSSITSNYISSGSIPVNYQPYALYEEATPDVSIFLNGNYLKYKQDWSFLLKQENTITVAAIALSPAISLALDASDVVTINYFSTF